MNKKILAKAVWRYAQFLLAFVLAASSVSALYVAFSFLSIASEPGKPMAVMPPEDFEGMEYEYWNGLQKSFPTPMGRKVTFDVSPSQCVVTLELSVEKDSPLAQTVMQHGLQQFGSQRQTQKPGDGFIESFFGWIVVDGVTAQRFSWEEAFWSVGGGKLTLTAKGKVAVEPRGDAVYVAWETPPKRFADSESAPYPNFDDKMRLVLKDAVFSGASVVPASVQPNEVVFNSSANVHIALTGAKPRLTRQQFLNNIGNIAPPFLSRLLFALVELAPLAALTAFAYGAFKSRVEIPAAFKQFTFGLLGFHFILYFFLAHKDFYAAYLFPVLRAYALENLGAFMTPEMRSAVSDNMYRAFTPLFVAVVCVLLPLLAPRLMEKMGVRWERADEKKGGKRGRVLIPLLEILPALGVLFSGYWLWRFAQVAVDWGACEALPYPSEATLFWYWAACSVPQWAPLLFTMSLSVLFLRWAIALMTQSLFAEEPDGLASWIGALAALFIVAYPFAFSSYWLWQPRQSWGWMAFNILFGGLLLYRFGMAMARYAGAMQVPLDVARFSRWILPFAFLFAVPAYYGDGRAQDLSYPDDLARLVFALDNLLIYVWVAAVLWLLYRDGKDGLSLGKSARWIGVLGAASVLFNVTARWLYIPATFLLGWLVLLWLTRREEWEGKRDMNRVFQQVTRARAFMLQKISLLRMAEHTFGALQKKKREKVSANEEDVKKALQSIGKHAQEIEKMRKFNIKGVDRAFEKIPLAFGPKDSAWQNGLHGAKWSLALSLPWLTMNFVSFMQETSFPMAYALQSVNSVLSILAFWGGVGFVMGYFFPYLRGDSGLQKGIRLAFAVILPYLPLHILHYQTLEHWQGFFLWAFQVFSVCVALGLFAFDYLTIRGAGKSWETLLEIHGLLPVGVWTSGVFAGLAAAVSGWITNPAQAQAWLSSAAQIILPILSQADK